MISNKKVRNKKVRNKKEIGFLIAAFLIPLINFAVFYVYLNANSFLLGFQKTVGGTTTWGVDNFKTIFKLFTASGNSELTKALGNTAIWFLFSCFINIPCMLTTYFIYKKIPGRKFIAFMSLLPSLLPSAAYVGFVKYVLAPNGVYGYICEEFFNVLPKPLLKSSEYATKTMLVYQFLVSMGLNMLWSGAMHSIDASVIEAGKIDGVGWLGELVYIIIPLIFPTLSVSLMFLVAGILGASGPILVFTNGQYGTSTLAFWIFNKVQGANSGGAECYELPAAMGLLMSCISIPLVLLVRWLSEKVEVY